MVITRSVWGSAFSFDFGFGLSVFGGGPLGSAGRLLRCGRFGGGPLGSGGLMLPRAFASTFGRAADETSKLAASLAIGGGGTGRALSKEVGKQYFRVTDRLEMMKGGRLHNNT